MKISIEYCGTCNYRPIAAALALMIEQATGIKADLVHSNRAGVFEITVDGVLVHSKYNTGVFPDNQEIVSSIRHSNVPAGDELPGGAR